QTLTVDLFSPGELVDVVGMTKGKGFQGGVKRYGWYGGDATHGSMFHRAPGSIGASSDPSRVWPGHHPPGRMGGERATVPTWAVRVPLLHQGVVRELAARRVGTHDTKGRSEVSGGGRKPWRQKGTGRARQGSIRATQWKGGGKPFGPTPRRYDKRMPTGMRRAALREALAAKIAAGGVSVVERFGLGEARTKALPGRVRDFGIE